MFLFGSGVMTITPTGATPTPINIGLLQEGSIEMSQTLKELYGQYKDPVALGGGTRKWTGKAKTARISGYALNALFFNATMTGGYTMTAYEAAAVPAGTPWQVTVANAATFKADLGVVYAATGLPLTRGATALAAGIYSVNTATGIYTFNTADASTAVVIAYNYTVAGSGQNFAIPQTLLGSTVSFALNFTAIDPTNNTTFTGIFYNCVAEKFSLGTKLEDFVMPEFDFRLAANAAGVVGALHFPDKA